MQYQHMKLQAPLHGLRVRSPIRQGDTAVIEGLTNDYDLEHLRPIIKEIARTGVRNVVFDVSSMPAGSHVPWVGFLDGAFSMARDFNTRYVGVSPAEVAAAESSFRNYIIPKIAANLNAAVEGFPRE